jgi:hypothetical protein
MSMAVIVLPPLAAILLLLSTWTPPEMTAVAPLSAKPASMRHHVLTNQRV